MISLRARRLGPIAAALSSVVVLASPALAAGGSLKVKNGYYAANERVKSADVEFHVRQNGTLTSDLTLVCLPKDPALLAGSIDAQIGVRAPLLKIRGGQISYHGPALVGPASAGEKPTGNSTLSLSLHRVNGPTIHFVNTLGDRASETAAWKGSVSSPACQSISDHGKLTLFGD